MNTPKYGTPITIEQLEAMNTASGHHFFSRGAKSFFKSRTDNKVFAGAAGWYFVTSEQFEQSYPEYRLEPRMYTVRIMREDGSINEVGKFQEYDNLRAARKVAEQTAKESLAQAGAQ